MSTISMVGYCMTAFGIGYACGYWLSLFRKAMNVLE